MCRLSLSKDRMSSITATPARRLRRIRMLAVAAVAAAVACSNADGGTGTASGIGIGDRLYYATCAPVDESLLSNELGRHKFHFDTLRVRAVTGIEQAEAVAVLQPDGCALRDITWTLWPSDINVAGMLTRLKDYRHLMDQEKLDRLLKYEECIKPSNVGTGEECG